MPLIDVTYDQTVADGSLQALAQLLPEVVSEAIDCPEDPSVGPPQPGDVEVRFRRKSSIDVGELNVLIELRTKLFESRLDDKQQRADRILERLSALRLGQVGVWLILSEGAWAQGS